MLRTNKKAIALTSVVTLLPILVGLILWDKLPNSMAVHFNTSNEADRFSNKAFAVIGLPIILLAVQLFCLTVTAKDPRKQNISKKIYTLILWIVPCISIFSAILMYPYNLGVQLDISLIAGIFMGLLLMIIGNYLPKTRHNYTIGIKLPWTLTSEENWNKTHHLAGIIWIIAGIVMIVASIVGIIKSGWLILGVLLFAVIVPSVYSFMLHAKKEM